MGNADKVKVYGDGLTSGTANEVNEFYVDTKDAGNYYSNWNITSSCATKYNYALFGIDLLLLTYISILL